MIQTAGHPKEIESRSRFSVCLFVCLSLLKFTLFERGENKPPYDRPGRLNIFFDTTGTIGTIRTIICKPGLTLLPAVIVGSRCTGAATNVLWRAGSGHFANPPGHCLS